MMKRVKSGMWSCAMLLYALPVIVISVLIFSCTDKAGTGNEDSFVSVKDSVEGMADENQNSVSRAYQKDIAPRRQQYKTIGEKYGLSSIPYDSLDVKPEFPGGYTALVKFIYTHLEYPKEAVKDNIEGTVLLEFILTPNCSISRIYVRQSPSILLSKEVVRVVRMLPKWSKPGKINGNAVPVVYLLPVTFRLSEE